MINGTNIFEWCKVENEFFFFNVANNHFCTYIFGSVQVRGIVWEIFPFVRRPTVLLILLACSLRSRLIEEENRCRWMVKLIHTLFIKIELEQFPDSINKEKRSAMPCHRQGAIICDIVPLAANFQTLNLSKNLLCNTRF